MRDAWVRRRSLAPEQSLAGHLRTTLWGPAEFVGLPGRRVAVRGLAVGVLGTAAVAGAGFTGMWWGPPALRSGEGGLVALGVLLVHLAAIRAGRALIGVTAALGICLALTAPQFAAGVVLEARGRVEPLRVTTVEAPAKAAQASARHLCSVSGGSATEPLAAQVWRGCTASKRPGDLLAVVYDPERRAPTRGLAAPGELSTAGLRLATLASAFAAVTAVAAVRSFRLTTPP